MNDPLWQQPVITASMKPDKRRSEGRCYRISVSFNSKAGNPLCELASEEGEDNDENKVAPVFYVIHSWTAAYKSV